MRQLQRIASWILGIALVFGGGFLTATLTADEPLLDEAQTVHYETASSIFPVEGAQFTQPFDDPEDPEAGCDKEAFKRFLNADPHRKEAWLEVLGVEEEDFEEFVDRLVSARLTEPTHVTNHGCFPEGEGPCPFEVHSVLAAGTLVLADPETDQIVTRCRCGNPLLEPKCPPNCEDEPTPTPTLTPTITPTSVPTPTPCPGDLERDPQTGDCACPEGYTRDGNLCFDSQGQRP